MKTHFLKKQNKTVIQSFDYFRLDSCYPQFDSGEILRMEKGIIIIIIIIKLLIVKVFRALVF
jgi:hypothetical protein